MVSLVGCHLMNLEKSLQRERERVSSSGSVLLSWLLGSAEESAAAGRVSWCVNESVIRTDFVNNGSKNQ